MTIANENYRNNYAGNDATTVFAYSFKVVEESDLEVIVADADDDRTTLTLTTHYTVSGEGDAGGGNVTLEDLTAIFGQATLPTGWTIAIARRVEVIQETDLENQGEYFAQTHEDVFDYLTMVALQQQEELDRCPKTTTTSGDSGEELMDSISDSVAAASASATAASTSETNAATSETNAETAKTAAELAETNAETAETNAETAETNAETAQTAAELAETNAETAETNAETAQTAAELAETNAETAETNAETAETNAETAKTGAETAQTAAELAETNAETAETNAETAKTGAETAKTGAETAQTAAELAETNAETAETNAETAQTAAELAETNAETAETNAVTAQTAAELAETNAETAETNAETAETNAVTAQTAAELAETNAETAETNAVTAKNAAETAQTNAETAETNAETAETNAETAETGAVAALAAAGLPGSLSGEAGKILKVKGDESAYEFVVPQDLPTIVGGDTLKMVQVEVGETGYELVTRLEQIQDYTVIGDIGDVAQQMAGHIWATDEGGAGTDLALYPFLNGDLTDDSEGTYDLTNNNTVTDANGIMGSDNAADFDGTDQYFNQGTLLDVTPAAIAIDFWMLPDDGMPAGTSYIFAKDNVTGEDRFKCFLQNDGTIGLVAEESNNGPITLKSATVLTNGAQTEWIHVLCAWDTTYGLRLFINGVLEACDSSMTTLMGNGTDSDFLIGATAGPASYFAGLLSQVRIRNQVLTQKDVDLAYATRYAAPSNVGTEYKVRALAKEDGSDDFISQIEWGGLEVKRTASYIYRYGRAFGSTDKLKIIGEY